MIVEEVVAQLVYSDHLFFNPQPAVFNLKKCSTYVKVGYIFLIDSSPFNMILTQLHAQKNIYMYNRIVTRHQ